MDGKSKTRFRVRKVPNPCFLALSSSWDGLMATVVEAVIGVAWEVEVLLGLNLYSFNSAI